MCVCVECNEINEMKVVLYVVYCIIDIVSIGIDKVLITESLNHLSRRDQVRITNKKSITSVSPCQYTIIPTDR